MREFHSIAGFVEHLATVIVEEKLAEHLALDKCAKLLEKAAKDKLGEYQPKAGSFVAWAELKEVTQMAREKAGYTPNDPLLVTGELRDSIEHQVEGEEAVVGSNSDIAVYQELGTDKIPPRSFLGSAAVENADEVKRIVGREVVIALVGEEVFEGAIEIA